MRSDRASLPVTFCRFSCDRCGKRYATAEAPMLGSVYGVPCQACGHYIVLHGVEPDPLPPVVRWPVPRDQLSRAGPDFPTPVERLLPGATAPPRALPPADLRSELERSNQLEKPEETPAPQPIPPHPQLALVDLQTAIESATDAVAKTVAPDPPPADPGAAREVQTEPPRSPGAPLATSIDSRPAVEPLPPAIDSRLDRSGQTGDPGPARPADVPAAAERAAPEFLEPPAGVRVAQLSPEQVDALLEQYIRETSKPATIARPTKPTVSPQRAAPAARVISPRRGPALASILAVAVPALLAATGAYLERQAGEPAGRAAVRAAPLQEQAPAPAPSASVPAAIAKPISRLAPTRSAAPIRAPLIAVPAGPDTASQRRNGDSTTARAQGREPHVAPVVIPVARDAASQNGATGEGAPARAEEARSPREKQVAAAATSTPATPQIAGTPPPPEAAQPVRLTSSEVATVIASYQEAFEACVGDWMVPEAALSGLKVDLVISIDPTGAVTWAALGNRDIERLPLGGCLVDAGRKMVFPRFGGAALQVRIPLVLGQGAR